MEATGRLANTPADCIKTGEIVLSKRPFLRGRDCPCERDSSVVEPSVEAWKRDWERLPVDADGGRTLCQGCQKIDLDGSHVPAAM